MINRENFPYISSLHVNNGYALQNVDIPIFSESHFKHLILTGKNGSGKTTILRALSYLIQHDSTENNKSPNKINNLQAWIRGNPNDSRSTNQWPQELELLQRVNPKFTTILGSSYDLFPYTDGDILTVYFEAYRKVSVQDVSTVTKESDLVSQLNALKVANFQVHNHQQTSPAAFFKQYLVNKKVFQVFDHMDGNEAAARQQEKFFLDLESLLCKVFEYPNVKLEFVKDSFEFYIVINENRRITFNQLSAGFSAFLSILNELLLRVDLIRKQINDYSYDPSGFVFIDEPETHLHLEMQYQVLPWLTQLFPNLQFIVATHSPAVASSIKDATIFDLSTCRVLGDQAAGSSYTELMITHFGVKDEYSNVADDIILEIKEIGRLSNSDEARNKLLSLLESKGQYFSPGLRLEVEALLAGLE